MQGGGSRLSAMATAFLSGPSILGSSIDFMPPQRVSILVFHFLSCTALLELILHMTIA